MVTNHHVFAAYDNTDWNPGSSLPNLDAVIPAGATLKRFQVHGTVIAGTTNGEGLGATGNFNIDQTVTIVAGQYATRELLRRRVAIPGQILPIYDVILAKRIYSQSINGGDNEFLINQRCSYGLRIGAAFTVRYAAFISVAAGFGGAVSNRTASAVFSLFYETMP